MTKQHTPESVLDAINVTLQEIQNTIYDYWGSVIPWSQAQARIQRHALELRILNSGDLPRKGEPLIHAQASARAIERARAARDRLNAEVLDHPERCLDQPRDGAGGLVEPPVARMSFADESLEEGSADVFHNHCVSCGRPFVPGFRGIAVGGSPDDSGLLVMCHDCAGTDLPRSAP